MHSKVYTCVLIIQRKKLFFFGSWHFFDDNISTVKMALMSIKKWKSSAENCQACHQAWNEQYICLHFPTWIKPCPQCIILPLKKIIKIFHSKFRPVLGPQLAPLEKKWVERDEIIFWLIFRGKNTLWIAWWLIQILFTWLSHSALALNRRRRRPKTENRVVAKTALRSRSSKKKFYDNFPSRMHSVA